MTALGLAMVIVQVCAALLAVVYLTHLVVSLLARKWGDAFLLALQAALMIALVLVFI